MREDLKTIADLHELSVEMKKLAAADHAHANERPGSVSATLVTATATVMEIWAARIDMAVKSLSIVAPVPPVAAVMDEWEAFESWWQHFKDAHEEWEYADSEALRWAAWQARAAQSAPVPTNLTGEQKVAAQYGQQMTPMQAMGFVVGLSVGKEEAQSAPGASAVFTSVASSDETYHGGVLYRDLSASDKEKANEGILSPDQDNPIAAPKPTDSMGIPIICGKPLCTPNAHHPLCEEAHTAPPAGSELPYIPTWQERRAKWVENRPDVPEGPGSDDAFKDCEIAEYRALAASRQAPQEALEERIHAICDAYESGIGHGLQQDGLHNGAAYYASNTCAAAYTNGYAEGEERAKAQQGVAVDAVPVAWRVKHGEFRHYSGGMVPARDDAFMLKPDITGYYDGCTDLTVTPLYDHAAPVPAPDARDGVIPALQAIITKNTTYEAYMDGDEAKRRGVIHTHDIGRDVIAAVCSRKDPNPQPSAAPADNKIYCKEKLKPGGCRLHNLHCGWPKCNAAPADQTELKGSK